MDYIQTIKQFYRHYGNFSGRTNRRDYWIPTLSYYMISLVVVILTWVLFANNLTMEVQIDGVTPLIKQSSMPAFFNIVCTVLIVIWTVLSFLSIIPLFSAAIRRYRDSGLNQNGIIWLIILNVLFSFVGVGTQNNDIMLLCSFLLGMISFVILLLPSNYLVGKSRTFTR